MLAISNSPAASIVAKITVIAALGLIAGWLARGNRAAVRHALLASTFGAMLLVPMAAWLMPPLHVGVPVGPESQAPLFLFGEGPDSRPSIAKVGAGTDWTPAPPASKLLLSDLLLAGWAAGAGLFLLPVVFGLRQIRSLRRSGLPWRRGHSVVEFLARDTGLHRRIEVMLHTSLPGPMTCGLVRPVIVLPRDAENWNPEELNRAMLHEMEHVRRGDSASGFLARATCALYWFHPLVWITWRKLVLEAERCCDDAVLRRSEATAYAEQLVGLAKRLSVAQRSPLLSMASRADLATRVDAVLDSRQPRGRAGVFSVALACGAAAALVITLSPLRLVARPSQVAPAESVTTPQSAAFGITVDAQVKGESHENSGPGRLLAQSQPARVPQIPATAAPGRLLCLFFAPSSLDAGTLPKALEDAIHFVQDQTTPADRISVMTYTSRLNVLQDFTDNHDRVLAALRTIAPANAGNNGAGNGIPDAEFAVFTADRLLAAIQNAVEVLAVIPEKKALLLFSDEIPRNGVDNQAQLRATIDAAIHANVSIYPVGLRGPMIVLR